MKILILYNFLNHFDKIPSYKIKSNLFIKNYKKLSLIKLRKLINKLKNTYGNEIEIKLINPREENLNLSNDIKVKFMSDFLLEIDRMEYSEIIDKIKRATKSILTKFYGNLYNLKIFNINSTFIGKILEYEFIDYFNKILWEYEIINTILQMEDYDKAIIFNFSDYFLDLINILYSRFKNLDAYKDLTLDMLNKRFKWYIPYFLFLILINSLKSMFYKKKYIPKSNKKENIIIFGKKQNKLQLSPFKAVKPIYDYLENKNIFNPIYNRKLTDYLSLKFFIALIKFLYQIRKNWKENKEIIVKDVKYDSIKLTEIIKEFTIFDLYFNLIESFLESHHFMQFIKHFPPSLIITTSYAGAANRLILNYCKINNIPSLYIPLGANIVHDEVITKSEFSYISISGEKEKEYFLNKGISPSNVILTGRVRYADFYTKIIPRLTEVRDMFTNQIYQFIPDKFTILLTTNPIGEKSNKILLSTLISSLNELKLIDNFIIKLHPKENGMIYRKILEKLNVKPIIVRDYNIFALIKSCNLLLSRRSTTLLESMIVGTPVLVLDLDNQPIENIYKLQFLEEESIIKIKNHEFLVKELQKLVNNKEFYTQYSQTLKKIGREYSFSDENESPIEKIINLIFKIIKNKNQTHK